MPKAKHHLKHLYRTQPGNKSRRSCLRLDMNEAVPGLPERFLKSILSEVNSDFLAMYPEYKKLEEKIAAHNKVRPENICLSNGSDSAIKYIFDAYIHSGDKVLLTDPTFAMYPVYCKMFNARQIVTEYRPDLTFPADDFIKKISPDIKLAVVVNPNNPTGSEIKQNTLVSVIKKAADNDVLLIVDEAYFYFYPHSVIKYVKKYKNLIVLRTFSKLCGMAAARLGYATACTGIIENLKKVRPAYDINSLSALLAERILDDPDIIKSLLSNANDGKTYLTQKLEEEGIEYRESHANFILVKCRGRVNEIIKKLTAKNILVGGGFRQKSLKDYIRITIGDTTAMERFWKTFIRIWRYQL